MTTENKNPTYSRAESIALIKELTRLHFTVDYVLGETMLEGPPTDHELAFAGRFRDKLRAELNHRAELISEATVY